MLTLPLRLVGVCETFPVLGVATRNELLIVVILLAHARSSRGACVPPVLDLRFGYSVT
jgi:hypothetical protein